MSGPPLSVGPIHGVEGDLEDDGSVRSSFDRY